MNSRMYSFDDSIICPDDPTATPERIEEYRSYYKVKFDIVKCINPSTIVEIGVRAGYSAWAFLMASPDAKYYGFDADNGTHGGRGGPWTWWAKKILDERGFNFEINAPFDTQQVDELPISADFYHVDGDHTENGVYHDLEICYQSALIDAYILVDDYDYVEAAEVRIGTNRWLIDHKDDIEWEHIESLRGEILIRKKK